MFITVFILKSNSCDLSVLPVWETLLMTHEFTTITSTMNATCSFVHDDPLCFADISFPFYYSQKPYLIHGLPDYIPTLAAPVISYWCLSLFFHALDISGWKWLEKYRIHDSEEVQARNLATRSEVVWAVFLQQVIQTALGLISLSDKSTRINHAQQLRRIASFLGSLTSTTYGEPYVLLHAASFLYWWGVPIFQFLSAMYEQSHLRCIKIIDLG
jgi:sphinganine C4-monooxygenase